MKLEALRAVPLFRALDEEAAQELCHLLSIREVDAGVQVFNRGDVGDAMYLIETGSIRISVKDADSIVLKGCALYVLCQEQVWTRVIPEESAGTATQ